MKKTIEKSEQQAAIITSIGLMIISLDTEYCKSAAADMLSQANRQESMAVLNPSHPQIKNDILRKKAAALSQLTDYVETLKEVSALEVRLKAEEAKRNAIKQFYL